MENDVNATRSRSRSRSTETETSPLLGNQQDTNDRLFRNGISDGFDRSVDSSEVQVVEDGDQLQNRWKSIRVLYLAQFLMTLTYSLTISSTWPFLLVLAPSTNASFLGWVVAVNSLGQLVSSPLFGLWSNLIKSHKVPMAVTFAFSIAANLFYTYLQSMPFGNKYFLIACRCLVGVCAGNIAVLRSYISSATTLTERTGCMANISICQVVGFIMGPVIQAALVPISYPGPVEKPGLHFNMYTAPAFLSAAALLVNLILLLTIFEEHHIPDEGFVNNTGIQSDHADADAADSDSEKPKTPFEDDYKLDYVAVFSMLFIFFVVLFMFTMYETISTPVTMHMYAWSKSQAAFYQGFLFAGGGAVAFVVFIVIKPLSKRFSDRKLLTAGLFLCVGGIFLFISWGDKFPPRPMKPIYNISYSLPPLSPNKTTTTPGTYNFLEIDHSSGNSDVLPSINQPQSAPNAISPRDNFHSPYAQDFYHRQISSPQNRNDGEKTGAYNISPKSDRNLSESDHNIGIDTDSPSSSHRSEPNGRTYLQNDTTTTTNNTLHPPLRSSKSVASTTPPPPRASTASTVGSTKPDARPTPTTTDEPKGCPWRYHWCSYTPLLPLAQYIAAVALTSVGYPFCQVFTYVIYSKVLGPKPQGLWMGWLAVSGSLARILGPVYVSYTYDAFGPRVAYGTVSGLILVTGLFCLLVYRRLVPFASKRRQNSTQNA